MSNYTSRAIVRIDILQALGGFIYAPKTVHNADMPEGRQAIYITPHTVAGCVVVCTDGTCMLAVHDRSASFAGLAKQWHVPVKQLMAHPQRGVRFGGFVSQWCDLQHTSGEPSVARVVIADSSTVVMDGGGDEQVRLDDGDTKRPILEDTPFPNLMGLWARSVPTGAAPASWFDASYVAAIAKVARELGGLQKKALPMAALSDTTQHVRITFLDVPDLVVILGGHSSDDEAPGSTGNPRWLDELISPPYGKALIAAGAAG